MSPRFSLSSPMSTSAWSSRLRSLKPRFLGGSSEAIAAIENAQENQSVTWGRRARAGAVATREELRHPGNRSRAPPHLDQAADDVANHVVQEGIRRDKNGQAPAATHESRRPDGAGRRPAPSLGGAEGREVVLAAQQSKRPAHGLGIEGVARMPRMTAQE